MTSQTITGTATANFMQHGGNVSPAVKQLLNASIVSASATSAPAFFQQIRGLDRFHPRQHRDVDHRADYPGQPDLPALCRRQRRQGHDRSRGRDGRRHPTFQLNYTNPSSVSGRLTPVAPSLPVANTTAPVGATCTGHGRWKNGPSIPPCKGGDNGILSIQTVQQSATMTSGVYAIVLYKEIGLPRR